MLAKPAMGIASARAGQQGVTLLIALIVLVAMTLTGIALVRSSDTTNIIAGNMSFQQAAMHSGDSGVEAAVSWLEGQNNLSTVNLYADKNILGSCQGYTSSYSSTAEPPAVGTWDTWWNGLSSCQKVSNPVDSAGNTASFTIHRMCSVAGAPNSTTPNQYCFATPAVPVPCYVAGCILPYYTGQVYYRIISRIDGPRGTKSYVQAIVAL